MKRRFTTLLLALVGLTFTAWAAEDHDYVDLGYNSHEEAPFEYEGEEKDYSAYDLNGDGQFSIADVTFIVNKLKEMKSEE